MSRRAPEPAIPDPFEPERRGRWPMVLSIVGGILLLAALALMVKTFLDKPDRPRQRTQQIALIKQPPPPPPKPPEKPPEPEKIREEVKVAAPTPEPKPDEPKPQADDKPASDKPLGVDAEGGAGSDGFGLAGNKGGRDLLSTGAGPGGAYYSGLLQRQFFETLSRNRKLLQDEFRVVVRVWLSDDGRVQKADIVTGSGDAQVDDQIQATLMAMPALREVPPSAMRPMSLRLTNRS